MGCGESLALSAGTEFDSQVSNRAVCHLDDDFSKSDFQEARSSIPQSEALSILRGIAKDMTGKPPYVTVPPTLDKACFICCNSYTTVKYSLGVGPINDSITVAKNHKDRGFQVFFLHNSTADEFKEFLPLFLKRTKDALTVFFTGHGAIAKDKNGEESGGKDEAMIFDNGVITDDDLMNILHENANGKTKVLLLSDCCHLGSIWDIQSAAKKNLQLPPNIISISSDKDERTEKSNKVGTKSQGIFTHFFWKALNETPQSTPKQLGDALNQSLHKFNQHFVCAETSEDAVNKPLFTK